MKIDDFVKLDENLEVVINNQTSRVTGICTSENYNSDSVFFISNKKYFQSFIDSDKSLAGVLVIDQKFYNKIDDSEKSAIQIKCTQIQSSLLLTKNFSMSLSKISKYFYDLKISTLNVQVDGRKMSTTSIHPSARIGENVFVGENVTIEEEAVIMPNVTILPNCIIGKNTVIFPNVTIYANTKIGNFCRIHSGTVIGSDGFGYNFFQGVHLKVWHMGGVIIGDHVEMGSNCTIDQGTFSPTLIGEGSKLDNQVHIAHNVKIGKGVILCGQVGIAGSSSVGDYTVFGGKAGLSDGVSIGAKSQVAGACMVTSNWEDGSILGGHPARPLNEWMRGLAFVRKNSANNKGEGK